MVIAILVFLLFMVVFYYFTSTVEHLSRSIGMTFRMLLVFLFVFLVLGLLAYSYFIFL